MFPGYAALLSDADVRRTHEASLEVLDQVGLELFNARARQIYKQHGCRVEDDNLRVTMPPAVIEEFIQHVPNKFTFHARNPDYNRIVPDDALLTITASSAPNIIDPVTHEHRRSTSDDIARIA